MNSLQKRSILLVLMLFMALKGLSQEKGPNYVEPSNEAAFWESIQMQGKELDSLVMWQEQVLLHTDKKTVNPKDHLFFKAYLLTGPNQLRVSASDVLKVEILDENGGLVGNQYHKIIDGAAEGSFVIPKGTAAGDYYLRAYTRWMLNYGPENFATSKITIKGKNTAAAKPMTFDQKVAFFPEGGNLVAGLDNRVVVKLEHPNEPATRHIFDNTGQVVATMKNFGKGLGVFRLRPQKEKSYYLKLNGKKMLLPEIADLGYTMELNAIDDEKVVVKVNTVETLKEETVYLRGKVNGRNFFEYKINFDIDNSTEIDIPRANLPNGTLQLYLEDDFDQVWAKRPLHMNSNSLQFSAERYDQDNTSFVKIKVTDGNGMPVQTTLSTSLNRAVADTNSMDLENSRNQRFMNDLLVLTGQLPNDFALDKSTALPNEIRYNFQDGLEFYGRAYDLDAVALPHTKIQIIISGEGDAQAFEVTTNEEGLFKLSHLQIHGEADMVFRRVAESDKDKYVKVVPFDYETPPLYANQELVKSRSKQFIPKKQGVAFTPDENMDRLITLNGVTLVGDKPKKSRTPSLYGIEPTRVVYQDFERPKTIPQLFLNIPGVQISNLGNLNPSISMPKAVGGGPILWVIDGIPLSQNPVEIGTTPLADVMSIIPFVDVERIELLFGPQASIFGSRAAGGAILIYTRNGNDEDYFNRKKAQLTFKGYHNSLSFDEYQKQFLNKKGKASDNTLYWNPSLMTDSQGAAIIPLPNSMASEPILIDVKAITPDGMTGSLKALF